MANVESREMEPTKQEIFNVFPEISRGKDTLTNDRSVQPLWQVKMDVSGDPNFMTPSIYINQLILLAQILHSPKKIDYNLACQVEFSIKR